MRGQEYLAAVPVCQIMYCINKYFLVVRVLASFRLLNGINDVSSLTLGLLLYSCTEEI